MPSIPRFISAVSRPSVVTPPEYSACLAGLAQLIEADKVAPIIERTYPLADLAAAHKRVETGRVTGKVCVDVSSAWQVS